MSSRSPSCPGAWRYVDPKLSLDALVRWELWRLDDNGNELLMESFRSHAKAVATQRRYEARGHRQSYFLRRA